MRWWKHHKLWENIFLVMTVVILMQTGFVLAMEEEMPNNLDECHWYLDELLSQSDQEKLKHTPEEELDQYQVSLGSWIQNVWLQDESTPLSEYLDQLGVHDPDHMSSIVIRSYWCYLNQRPFDLLGMIAMYQEVEKQREEQRQIAEQKEKEFQERVQQNRVTLTVLPGTPSEVTIPEKMLWGGIAANDLIPYERGYMINAISTYPKGLRVSYAFYYLDLVEEKLYRLQVSGIDIMESLVVNDGILYVSGMVQSQRVVRRYRNGKMEDLTLAISNSDEGQIGAGSWVKLGFYENRLVALQRDAVYGNGEKGWELLKRFEMKLASIPTTNIRIYGDRLYFYQEISHEPSCELYYVDLQGEEGVVQVLHKLGVDTRHQEIVSGYGVDNKERLWVSATVEKDALISQGEEGVRYWVFDGQIQTEMGLQDFSSRVIFLADQRVLLMGQTGLYEVKDEVTLEPIVLFRNSVQEMKVEETEVRFHFTPRNVVYLGNDAYLIGCTLGGVYKLWKQDGKYHMVAYDDRMLNDLPVWWVE